MSTFLVLLREPVKHAQREALLQLKAEWTDDGSNLRNNKSNVLLVEINKITQSKLLKK